MAGVLMDFVCRRRFVQGARRVEVLYYLLDYRKDVKASEDRDTRWCTRAEARRLLSFEQLTRVLDRAWLVHTAAIRRA